MTTDGHSGQHEQAHNQNFKAVFGAIRSKTERNQANEAIDRDGGTQEDGKLQHREGQCKRQHGREVEDVRARIETALRDHNCRDDRQIGQTDAVDHNVHRFALGHHLRDQIKVRDCQQQHAHDLKAGDIEGNSGILTAGIHQDQDQTGRYQYKASDDDDDLSFGKRINGGGFGRVHEMYSFCR